MKKIILFMSLSVAAALLLMNFNVKSLHEEATEREDEKAGTAAFDYWSKMRANQKTGVVNTEDEIRAMDAMRYYDKSTQSMRGGSVSSINWNFRGPDNVGGRTRSILVDRTTGTIFAGGVSGGLWMSKNGGDSFSAWAGNYSDTVKAQTVTTLCQSANGDIYFGTGEGFYYNYGTSSGGYPGSGIWKSTDHGASFKLLSATIPTINNQGSLFTHINRLAASSKRAGVIYAATNRGVYKTLDSGRTWTLSRYNTGNTVEVLDLKITADDQYVICSNANGIVFRGHSSNATTDTLTQISAIKAAGRVEIAVSQDSANYIYLSQANVSNPGNASSSTLRYVYQSKDFGATWSVIGTGQPYDASNASLFDPLGFQGDYDNTIAVVPGYNDVIYVAGQFDMWRWSSINGWEKVTSNYSSDYIHPDMHTITFNPLHPNIMYVGCDGGIYKSTNGNISPKSGTPTFQNINHNYSVTQQYSCASDASGRITIGGAQDNGTHLVNGSGYTVHSGTSIGGGDGGKTEISQFNSLVMFGAAVGNYNNAQNGSFIQRSINGGASAASIYDKRADSAGLAKGALTDGANFVTPFCLFERNYPSPWTYNDTSYLAVASSSGTVWICPNATATSASFKWFRLQKNGQGNATAIAVSSDGNHLYVGYNNGEIVRYDGLYNLFKTGRWHYKNDTSYAATWHAADSGITMKDLGNFNGQYVTAISVDFQNPNHITISLGNYGNTNYIYESHNATSSSPSFKSLQGSGISGIPHMPMYACCIDAVDSTVILAGTEMGVYVSADDGKTWVHKSAGMGNLPITQIRQYFQSGVWRTYVATHGHGIYSTGLWTGVNSIYPKSSPVVSGTVYPNPSNTSATLHFHTTYDATYNLNVYDLTGKMVYTQNTHNLPAGENNINIPVANLTTGIYIIQLVNENNSKSFKMIVAH